MRVISLCLCCMLMACVVVAQRNYVPGVIITRQNDSLKGFIDFRNWYQSPNEIVFKESLSNAEEQRFKPADINGFKVAEPEVEYVSRKLHIDITRQDINSLNEKRERIVQDTPVFLMRIVTGPYNLYEYIDMFSRAHYVYDASGVPATELEYVQQYVERSSGSGIFTEERYKDQLAALFADNAALAEKARKISYREANLKKLFLAYNNGKAPASGTPQPVTMQKKKRLPVTYGIMAGMAFNSYPFKGSAFIGLGEYENSKGPIGGIWADIPLGRNGRNISFVPELLYKKLETNGVLHGTYSGAIVKFAFSYLQVNTLFRYTYPTKTAIRPYINAGIGNGFVVKVNENGLLRSADREWEVAINGPRKYEQTLIGGLGVKIYKVNAEVRYTTGNGFSPFPGGRTAIHSFQILAAYGF
ncbi:PorT family protein [Chitinophaga filiformis]|uniref:PorT family protein n=1 Tax=Chitinophaga filiformis TaxID=104663 RepID=UPI001F43F1A5|nr:PorT family protein [Chitinophaga filiformis]MCF6402406.1 PorT family protein [Chitinophaga filiformis]